MEKIYPACCPAGAGWIGGKGSELHCLMDCFAPVRLDGHTHAHINFKITLPALPAVPKTQHAPGWIMLAALPGKFKGTVTDFYCG